jgi:hypothetical protein
MTLMPFRRRFFAAGALIVVLAHLTAVLAVPLAACAAITPAAHHDSVECCPAGSHPPGECPLHRQDAKHSGGCRLTCATQGSTPFVPGIAGVLPPAFAMATRFAAGPRTIVHDPSGIFRSITPASPPPKSAA